MSQPDPLLVARLHADNRFRRGEAAVYAGVIAAMTIWLDTARALVLHRPIPAAAVALLDQPLTAAGDQTPDIDAARAATEVWARAIREHVEPALESSFGEAFLDAMRRADYSPLPFQLAYLEQVHDRLRIWPEGAFEEMRPELLEMLSEGMSIDQVEERIGRLLDIDAPSRRARAHISEIDRQIADPETPRADLPGLRARRRALWQEHDESLGQWQWLARRIARTEVHGAIEGGNLAAAQAAEQATGKTRYKRWLSTTDTRVRGTHAVADGQIVELGQPFRVGRAELQHPGEAGGPAHEVINCRCTMLILERDEVDAELAGSWGGRGVGPGHVRVGPDDLDDVDTAVRRWTAEQRGETVDDDPDDTPPDPDPDPVVPPDPGPDDVDPLPDDEPDDHDDGIEIIIEDDEDEPSDEVDDEDPVDEDDPDDELDDDQDDEPDPLEVLTRETVDRVGEVRRSLPADAAQWRAITAERVVRPAETFGERYMWQVEQQADRAQRRLDRHLRAHPELAAVVDPGAALDELDRLEQRQIEVMKKLARARSQKSIDRLRAENAELTDAVAALRVHRELLSAAHIAATQLERARTKPPKRSNWNQIQPEIRNRGYVEDANGNLLPPEELDDHLDAVMELGEAVLADIMAAFDRDTELVELRAQLDTAAAEFRLYEVIELRREVAVREARIVRVAMADARAFGGHEQRAVLAPSPQGARAGRQVDLDDLRAVEPLFPQEWLEAADARGHLQLGSSDRAFFRRGVMSSRDLIAGSRSPLPDYNGAFPSLPQEVMAHELGHRMEQAVPGLMQLEFAYVRRRGLDADGNLEPRQRIYAGKDEWALFDKWFNSYAGKVYDWGFDPATSPHEVFQVGLQDLFGRGGGAFNGLELQAFMLGVMLTL